MIQMTPQSHKVHPNALLNLLLRKSLTMTRKLLKEETYILKKTLAMSLIDEPKVGYLLKGRDSLDLQFLNMIDYHGDEVFLMTDMAKTLPFHRYQYLQFQLHTVAILLEFAIHL